MNQVPLMPRAILLSLLVLTVTSCSLVRAKTPAPVVALETPPPPARVAVPVALTEPEDLTPPPAVATAPSPAPPRSRDTTASARPADRPATSPPAATPPEPAPTTPAPVLQTTRDVGSVQQKTEWLLGQAQRDLDTMTPRRGTLGSQARGQYDNAAAFIRNARKALEVKNYMLAEQLATKAAALASALVKG
jgi:hypothetical protein